MSDTNGIQSIFAVHQTINGRTSWKSASKAIWYIHQDNDYEEYPFPHGYWAIGDLKNIGNEIYDIKSDVSREDESPWQISNDYDYYSDIIFECKNDKGKQFLCNSQ